MRDRRADLRLDVVADDRHAGLLEAALPVGLAGDEDRHAVHHRAARVQDLLRVPLGRLLGADREVVDDDVGLRLLEDPDHVVGLAGRLLDDLREVLADAVVRHPARDRDAGLRDVGELDRVVRVRPHRVGEVDADLALDDVERGDELDVADVVAAEVDVHQPGDEVLGIGVLVVLDALEERVGAVADADDRDADLVVRATLPLVLPFVEAIGSFPFQAEPLGERPDDQLVHVLPALGCAPDEALLQLGRHAQQHRPALARRASPSGRSARRERRSWRRGGRRRRR